MLYKPGIEGTFRNFRKGPLFFVLIKPYRGVGTGCADLAALLTNLVDSHLYKLSGDALTAKFITYIGVINRVNARLEFRKSNLRENPAVFILALDAVGKSDLIHSLFSCSVTDHLGSPHYIPYKKRPFKIKILP